MTEYLARILIYAVIIPVYIFGKEPLGLPNMGLVIFMIVPIGTYYNPKREQEEFKTEREKISAHFASIGLDLFADLDEQVHLIRVEGP